jgi:1-acyl-sn-glycerol-3-phosphate acyltransferase
MIARTRDRARDRAGDPINDRTKAHTKDRPGPLAYRVARTVLDRPLHLAYQVDVQGAENVPVAGPVILAANHRSFMDSIFLALSRPEPIAFIAKAEYFDKPLTRAIFSSTGQIPMRRGSPSAGRQALDAARAVLADGGTVGVYPEGTRSRDGKLHRGNAGPARLAMTSGAPLVPVGLVGTDEVQRPGERLPHMFRHVTVRFGEPRYLEDSMSLLREETNGLMHAIADLCGQEYEDQFAL